MAGVSYVNQHPIPVKNCSTNVEEKTDAETGKYCTLFYNQQSLEQRFLNIPPARCLFIF
jgi:hypothetical protein